MRNLVIVDDIIGKRFGRLVVKQYSRCEKRKYERGYDYYYICSCDCNLEKRIEVLRHVLITNNTKSCGCFAHPKQEENVHWGGCGEISGNLWSHIRKNAKIRNIDFDLTIEDAWNQYEKQNKKCSYINSNLSLLYLRGEESNITGSLDRMDSSKGYTKDNIQWVHKDINIMKGGLLHSQFIELCNSVAYPANIIDVNPEFNTEIRGHQWRGYGEISGKFWTKIGKNAVRRKLEFVISIENAWDKFISQKGRCALNNWKLVMYSEAHNQNYIDRTASLDRIDNTKGYIAGNIQWIHKELNRMKWDLNQDRYIELCKAVTEHII